VSGGARFVKEEDEDQRDFKQRALNRKQQLVLNIKFVFKGKNIAYVLEITCGVMRNCDVIINL
jgi:hypothetical protein